MADEQPPKKKSKLKWIILLLFILILGGAGFGVWKLGLIDKFMGGGSGEEAKPAEQAGADGRNKPMPGAGGLIVPLKTYTTNLADPLGRRLIRIALSVQVVDEQSGRELQTQDARVSDTVLMLLSSKSYADIAAPESKEILKSEVLSRLNLILGGPKVTQVLITDFFVQ